MNQPKSGHEQNAPETQASSNEIVGAARDKRYRVVRPHESEFPCPITFRKGAPLVVGEEYVGSEGWDNWFLCGTPGQESGWVPGQIIERLDGTVGRALEDYTARELDADKGEVLNGTRELNGWLWCEKTCRSASGWVPLENLEEIPE